MPFNLSAVETQLSLPVWRDTQLSTITAQFEAAFPVLERAIVDHVAQVRAIPIAQKTIVPWAEEQGRTAAACTEEGLADILATLPPRQPDGPRPDRVSRCRAGRGLGRGDAGGDDLRHRHFGLASGFSIAMVSPPILLAGDAAIAALSPTGIPALSHAKRRTCDHLAERLKRHPRSTVSGDDPAVRCLLKDT